MNLYNLLKDSAMATKGALNCIYSGPPITDIFKIDPSACWKCAYDGTPVDRNTVPPVNFGMLKPCPIDSGIASTAANAITSAITSSAQAIIDATSTLVSSTPSSQLSINEDGNYNVNASNKAFYIAVGSAVVAAVAVSALGIAAYKRCKARKNKFVSAVSRVSADGANIRAPEPVAGVPISTELNDVRVVEAEGSNPAEPKGVDKGRWADSVSNIKDASASCSV